MVTNQENYGLGAGAKERLIGPGVGMSKQQRFKHLHLSGPLREWPWNQNLHNRREAAMRRSSGLAFQGEQIARDRLQIWEGADCLRNRKKADVAYVQCAGEVWGMGGHRPGRSLWRGLRIGSFLLWF